MLTAVNGVDLVAKEDEEMLTAVNGVDLVAKEDEEMLTAVKWSRPCCKRR